MAGASLVFQNSGAKVGQTSRIKTVIYRGRTERITIVREGLNSSLMDDFGDAIGGEIELLAQYEIDVEHRKGIVFDKFIKAFLNAHVPFGAIRRFGVHCCKI